MGSQKSDTTERLTLYNVLSHHFARWVTIILSVTQVWALTHTNIHDSSEECVHICVCVCIYIYTPAFYHIFIPSSLIVHVTYLWLLKTPASVNVPSVHCARACVCVSASGEERAHCMLYLCSGLWSSPLLVLLHFWLRYWQFKARPCWEDRREKLKLLSIYCRVIDLRIILIFFIFPKSLNSHEFSAPSEENQAHNKAKPMAMLAESRLIPWLAHSSIRWVPDGQSGF